MNNTHRPVLLAEAVTAMIGGTSFQKESAFLIDGTFGRGGHSKALLEQIGSNCKLIAFDKDLEAISTAQKIIDPRLQIIHSSFAMMDQYVKSQTVDAVLLDLGISSPQIDTPERGFSFRFDGPLDMRMDTSCGVSAAQWLASSPVEEITQVIKTFGEERFAFAIARAIVKQREEGKAVETTLELSNLIAKTVRTREPGQDPATRTFQAIRIFINQELADLERGLEAALDVLKIGGRLVVISFHSLEDRRAKRFIKQQEKNDPYPSKFPIFDHQIQRPVRSLGKWRAENPELALNPRARSAVMRAMEKIA